ncbi:hypothetical protein [Bordetella muralis]|uniref:hypothetical protein n=1 Tax=Bordetella muralis TaxID=1649130 RepID=UPI0039F03358
MWNRKSLVTIAIAGSLLGPMISSASQTFEITNDEIGVATHYAPTSVTREQIREDLAAWKAHPVSSDGWRESEADQGWQGLELVSHTTSRQSASIAIQKHEHWRAIDGEAGWVEPFGA